MSFAVLFNVDLVRTHGLMRQEYMPEALRVWNDGAWLEYDLKEETEAVRAERLWSEAALQAQRRSNARWHLSSTQSNARVTDFARPQSVSKTTKQGS